MDAYLEQARRWTEGNPIGGKLAVLAVTIVLGFIAYYVTRSVIVRIVELVAKKSSTQWDDAVVKAGVFNRLALVTPGLIVLAFAEPLPGDTATIQRLVNGYLMLVLVSAFNRLLTAVLDIYSSYPFAKDRPIKGYIQIVKLFLVLAGTLVVLATIMDRSPFVFLSGLGAMTAVLLLVFRDTILSFVASIQIATNDMVRIGDWIEMPKYGADGDVIDIALHTVKIQNWDKTITTIPTHALIEDSFKNWRGMQQTGGRRIARAINIDTSTVHFLSEEETSRLSKIQLIEDYIQAKKDELATWNETHKADPSSPINGRRMTNIGTFRMYLLNYLKNHPRIRQDMTLLVRQLPAGESGVPIQLYCFTSTTVWAEYEGIQGDLFDHILAALPEFGLRAFQPPTGADIAALRS